MSVVDLAPRDGVWTIPADDPLDLSHEICLDMLDETTMGLTLLLSGDGCLLSTSEAIRTTSNSSPTKRTPADPWLPLGRQAEAGRGRLHASMATHSQGRTCTSTRDQMVTPGRRAERVSVAANASGGSASAAHPEARKRPRPPSGAVSLCPGVWTKRDYSTGVKNHATFSTCLDACTTGSSSSSLTTQTG